MYFRWPSAKMVSKASELLPEPERPVMTTSRSRGMLTSMFLRLCSLAPWTRMQGSSAMAANGVGRTGRRASRRSEVGLLFRLDSPAASLSLGALFDLLLTLAVGLGWGLTTTADVRRGDLLLGTGDGPLSTLEHLVFLGRMGC